MKKAIGGFVLGALAICSILAAGEAQTCVESTESGYDYEVQCALVEHAGGSVTPGSSFLKRERYYGIVCGYRVAADNDLTIRWTVDATSEEITFQVVYSGSAWVSVGFSEDGDMIGADCVIGLPDESTALEYTLDGKSLSDVVEASNQEISGASVTQAGGSTTLEFTRPLTPSGNKIGLSSTEGEEAIFIWAYGTSNALAQHDSRDAITLSDIYCTAELEATTTTGDSSCASSDPDYEYEYSPEGSFTLFWGIVDDDTAVSVKAVYEGEGWLAVGFSDSGSMPGSDAVVGLPDDGTALEYDMPNYSTPTEHSEQELTSATITQSGGTTTLTFTRLLDPTEESKQNLAVGTSTDWLYAWGGGNTFSQHVNVESFGITLGSCDISRSGGNKKEYAHGWLMVLGWSVFFPLGILSARFSPDFANVGFPAHRALQSLGFLFVIAGFVIAIVFTEDSGQDHFSNDHAKFGLTLTVLLGLQVFAAICRPSAPKGGGFDEMGGNYRPDPKPSTLRCVWSWGHRLLGYAAVVLAVLQCIGGFELLDEDDIWRTIYLAVIAIMVVFFVIFQCFACLHGSGRGNVRQASGPISSRPNDAYTGTASQVDAHANAHY